MIIFLYGGDSFRSRRKLSEIKNKYLEKDQSGSGLVVFDAEEEINIAQKIIETSGTPNLFSSKRLLVVKNFLSAGPEEEKKKLLEYLEKEAKEKNGSVIVFWESGKVKKSEKIFQFLEKNSKSQKFEKLAGIKLNQWTLKSLEEINSKSQISKKALDKLIVFVGDNTEALFGEISKLANYCNGKMIEEKDVDLLVRSKMSENIFQMVDALGDNNKKEALRLFHGHLEKGDDPFYLLSMFFYQFRNMLKVAEFWERGIKSEYEISRLAKIHPYVAKKSLAQIAHFPFSKLKNIYQKLGELDTAVKTGKIEIKLALDKFIVEL